MLCPVARNHQQSLRPTVFHIAFSKNSFFKTIFIRVGGRHCFFTKKKRLRQRSSTKTQFFHKKKRLRQRSSTKKQFFTKKGACGNVPGPKTFCFNKKETPAAAFQDQKRNFPSKKGACGNVPGPKTFFAGTQFFKKMFLQAIFLTLSHLAFEEGGGTFINWL